MSLKDLLHSKIKELGYLSYGSVCQICAEEGYKVDTATRRLRELTDIEPVISKSKRGTNYISGYKYQVTFDTFKDAEGPMLYKLAEGYAMRPLYKVYEPVTKFNDPL